MKFRNIHPKYVANSKSHSHTNTGTDKPREMQLSDQITPIMNISSDAKRHAVDQFVYGLL